MGVLDDMTKGITEVTARKKAAAGASLTPVGLEAQPTKPSMVGVPDVPEVFLTNEAIADIAKDLRSQAATLVAVADGLDNLTQKPTAVEAKPDPKAEKKAKEKKADAKFAEEFEAKKQAAMAATFAADDPPLPTVDSPTITPATGGWTCPEHGAEDIEDMTSRLRPQGYLACAVAGCGEYEPKG